jgi:hypothetical protein
VLSVSRSCSRTGPARRLPSRRRARSSTLNVELNLSSKQLSVKTPTGALKTGYVIALARLAKLGKQEFKPGEVSLTPGGRALLKFRAFKRTGQTLLLSVRKGSSNKTTRLSG